MKLLKMPAFIFFTVASLMLASGCVTDPGVSKKRGLVNDFSITSHTIGCGKTFLILDQPDTCTTKCENGVHLATPAERTKRDVPPWSNGRPIVCSETFVVSGSRNQRR